MKNKKDIENRLRALEAQRIAFKAINPKEIDDYIASSIATLKWVLQ